MQPKMIGASALVCALLATSGAGAAPSRPPDTNTISYAFDDDDLLADTRDAAGALLKVRPLGARPLLIRPRTQFVAELLKSVENL